MSHSSTNLVECQNVTKKFSSTLALAGINLNLGAGRIYGLLGSNGAGKSTLITSILGLTAVSSGSIKTLGVDSLKLQEFELQRIGYVEQEASLIPWMKAEAYLKLVGSFYNSWDSILAEQLCSRFEIQKNKRIKTMSPGERQRLAIIAGISHKPKLLLLDEPASALDHMARKELLTFLIELIQVENHTILLSSHILTDIEKIVSDVVIMKAGQIVTNSSLDQLKENSRKVLLRGSADQLKSILQSTRNSKKILIESEQALLLSDVSELSQISALANDLGCYFEAQPASLEEIYEALMRGN